MDEENERTKSKVGIRNRVERVLSQDYIIPQPRTVYPWRLRVSKTEDTSSSTVQRKHQLNRVYVILFNSYCLCSSQDGNSKYYWEGVFLW